jgi:hypothetical protein
VLTDPSVRPANQEASSARPSRTRTALARCRQRVRSAATRRERACRTLPPWPANSPDFITSLQPEQLHATSVHSVRGDTRSDTREPGNGVQRWLSLATDDTQRPVNPRPPSAEARFSGRPSSRGSTCTGPRPRSDSIARSPTARPVESGSRNQIMAVVEQPQFCRPCAKHRCTSRAGRIMLPTVTVDGRAPQVLGDHARLRL